MRPGVKRSAEDAEVQEAARVWDMSPRLIAFAWNWNEAATRTVGRNRMRHDWQSVEMPPGIAKRPRDPRGFPITFVTLIQQDGTPDFTTIDAHQILHCITERLCGMCGEALPVASCGTLHGGLGHGVGLHAPVAFIGGPAAIEHKNFLDPPMHAVCAEYAMRVCPHIAIPTARYAKPKEGEGRRVFELVDPNRPDRFGMYLTKRYKVVPYDGQPVFLAAPADQIVWADELPTASPGGN